MSIVTTFLAPLYTCSPAHAIYLHIHSYIAMHINILTLEFIFAAFATLVNGYFDKIITTDSPKPHNPVKNMYIYVLACSFCL